MFKLIALPLAAAALTLAATLPVTAQNLFAPAAIVNDSPITEFEVQQRQRFLQLLNAAQGDRESIIDAMIDERLRDELVRDAGLEFSSTGVDRAMEDFAGRANLSLEEFVQTLERAGVARETMRDFVLSGVIWREYIRSRYGSRVQITEAEIDRALAEQGAGGGSNIRVLVSEIIIPAPPQSAAEVNALAVRIAQATTEAEFSSFARQYSATASRGAGGRLPWTPLSNLPASLQPVILSLSPGEVSQPLPIPNAVALFQLRAIEEMGAPQPEYASIEYAAYYLAGGRSEATLQQAANLAAEVDVCDDLYAYAKDQPESALDRETKKPGEIPQDIAFELSKLDAGEVSTALTRSDGQALVFLMLCKRTAAGNADVSREDVAANLRQQRLAGLAEALVAQQRAEARIVIK